VAVAFESARGGVEQFAGRDGGEFGDAGSGVASGLAGPVGAARGFRQVYVTWRALDRCDAEQAGCYLTGALVSCEDHWVAVTRPDW